MIFKIEATQRDTKNKVDLSQLRKKGFIPAVVYGHNVEPLSITLNKAEFMKLYKKSFHEIVFYEIQLAGKEYHTLLKERQMHPVTREILHIDFMVIPPHQKIEVDVPIQFIGTAIGTKTGGFMDVIQRTVKILCVEDAIPEGIEVDISHLEVGDVLHVNQLPQGDWIVKDNPDNAVVTIHAKKIEVEPVVEEVISEEVQPEEAVEVEQ